MDLYFSMMAETVELPPISRLRTQRVFVTQLVEGTKYLTGPPTMTQTRQIRQYIAVHVVLTP